MSNLRNRQRTTGTGVLSMTLLCVASLTGSVASADVRKSDRESNATESACLTPEAESARNNGRFRLSDREMRQAVAAHSPHIVDNWKPQLDEVVVLGPEELLPMHSEIRDIPGGLLAPAWAFIHPTQAWRIFLPIPPQ